MQIWKQMRVARTTKLEILKQKIFGLRITRVGYVSELFVDKLTEFV